MSSQDDLLNKAAAKLAAAADRLGADDSREVRARTIAAMEAALRAKARKSELRRRSTRFALAASFVLAALGGYAMHRRSRVAPQAEVTASVRRLDGTASTWRNGQPVPFEGALNNGDRVTTAAGSHAEIALSTGTSVVLGPSTDTTFTGANNLQSFSLATGRVHARVAKLHDGERFLVRTADVEVEVRGTIFEVSLAESDPSCGGGTRTRVSVTEGVVVVRGNAGETRVAAGESWPSGCVAGAPTPSTSVAVVTPPAPSVSAAPAPHPIVSVSASASVDALAAKNDLFASALAAKRRGELHVALAAFESYLTKYPSGELVESASAQRMAILGKLDSAKAAVAAKQYLASWPNGFAREEAEALSKGP